MTNQDILDEVATSKWQPEFEFTDDLDAVVDSILKPHEDYFLGLHSKVEEIIEREIFYAITVDNYKITFADACNWQKELFEHKMKIIKGHSLILSNINWQAVANSQSTLNKLRISERAIKLPNQYINLGLRQTNVKVGEWTPPAPMFLEDLKGMCFPLKISDNEFLTLPDCYDEGLIKNSKVDDDYFKYWITQWYKICMTCHYWDDLNGRVGGIVINILSYILTGKYLIK